MTEKWLKNDMKMAREEEGEEADRANRYDDSRPNNAANISKMIKKKKETVWIVSFNDTFLHNGRIIREGAGAGAGAGGIEFALVEATMRKVSSLWNLVFGPKSRRQRVNQRVNVRFCQLTSVNKSRAPPPSLPPSLPPPLPSLPNCHYGQFAYFYDVITQAESIKDFL